MRLISLSHELLAACAKTLTGTKIISPPEGRILRTPRGSRTQKWREQSSKNCFRRLSIA
jgi:hypothetical protein